MDNNCNRLIDDEDPACDAEVSLSVTNGNTLCNYQTQSFTINLRNREDVGIGEVSVTDRIYDSNNNLEYTGSAYCENVIANGICSNSYNVNLDTGSYYHNVNAIYGNNEQITKNNYNAFTVLSNDNVACCAEEGEIPTNGRICCDGRPADGANGACGCPRGFSWAPVEQECVPSFARCGYVNQENVCTSLSYIISHPIYCLFGGPESQIQESLPYEQACCPYVGYGEEDYFKFNDVEVY